MSSSTPWPAEASSHQTESAAVPRARLTWMSAVMDGAMTRLVASVMSRLGSMTRPGLKAALLATLWVALALGQPAAASTEALPEPHSQRERGSAEAGLRNAEHPQLPGSRLRGQGKLRFMGLGIYQARLWTPHTFRPEQALEQPVVLELTYLRDFGGDTIAQRSLDEMRRAGPVSDPQAQRWLAEMRRLFPDVRSGTRVTGLHQPGQGVTFWVDGRSLGGIADPEFGRRFFGIWLAPSTSQPGLRLSLLGLAAGGNL